MAFFIRAIGSITNIPSAKHKLNLYFIKNSQSLAFTHSKLMHVIIESSKLKLKVLRSKGAQKYGAILGSILSFTLLSFFTYII